VQHADLFKSQGPFPVIPAHVIEGAMQLPLPSQVSWTSEPAPGPLGPAFTPHAVRAVLWRHAPVFAWHAL
jgi:hypothetical protein